MASENGDPFDGLSPSASHMQEADTYDDLLGVQVPIEDFDLPMPDFQEEHPQLFHTPPIADMINQQVQNSNGAAERQGLRPTMMELCNHDTNLAETNVDITNKLESTATVPQQSEETESTELDHMSAVMSGNPASHDTDPAEVQASRPKKKTFTIKKEALDAPFTSGIAMNTLDDAVEISDTEDPDSIYKHGTKMSDGVIILSDEEDYEEIIVFDDGSTSVAIKKENPDVELLGATRGLVEVSDTENDEPSIAPDPKLGKSFLRTLKPRAKRTAADIQRMQQIQRQFAEKSLNRNLGPGVGVPLATPKVLQSAGLGSPSHSSNDPFAWMNEGVSLDDDTATDFRALKKSYSAKMEKGNNTLNDDIEFARAEKAENLRLARLKAEYEDARGYSDDENSDDGLFVSTSPPRSSGSKRRAADNTDAEGENPGSRCPKKRKRNGQNGRSQEELDEDQTANMLAGIELLLGKKKFVCEDEAGNSAEQVRGMSVKPSKNSKGKKSGPKSSNRKTKDHRNDLGDLLTSNVFDDATANNDRDALPVWSETDKRKAMTAIVASVPLENKQEARDDKATILRATKTLAPRKVTADGQGGWKLQGMASSLHNHQVLGANFMRMRETAGEQPLGGIVADGMVRLSYAGFIYHTTS